MRNLNNYEQYTIDLLRDLISYNTVNIPGNEGPLAERVAEILGEMGFENKLISCGENRGSVVAAIGNPKGKKLVFNGHLDVVPANTKWTTDPFNAQVIDGKIYGRGAADMKGGIASMITAAKKLIDADFDFSSGQLILSFVADEELHNKGTLSILPLEEISEADYVIVGEPTSMDINIAHRGTARYTIKLFGKSCHSSNPANGINAINKMGKVLAAIEKYNQRLSQIHHPILPSPTIATVMIEGGEKDNIIPNYCEIKIDRRIIPSDTKESVMEELAEILKKLEREDSEFKYTIEPYIYLGAGEVPIDSEITRLSVEAYKSCFGKEPKICEFTATCEQTLFTQNGIETIIVGPGSIKQAHIVDEYVEIEQLNMATSFYEEMIKVILR
ncbi:acetylornithine deacetylase [Anaerovirgula multivorans]|uniref:Acetylornithine deacetylase n=1 Tax=Anaerovirgula multivorans TaxID=312168 RepID=A0A239IBI5_9FIRM|nr:M20 family metallopeptidase [Anaerovirgula multivorans]SNS90927.1 acetylornithine deacetylase [Anaerovirgula multivorans]